MELRNSDLILYAINEVKKDGENARRYTRSDLSRSLNIKEQSFSVYLSKLSKSGMIDRLKRHYSRDMIGTISITEKGSDRIEEIEQELERTFFTPERHFIPKSIKYTELRDRSRNPLERIFLLNLYLAKYSFDLNDYLQNLGATINDFSVAGYFRKLESSGSRERPYSLEILNLSLYGTSPIELSGSDQLSEKDTNALIIHAETMRKQGKFEYARIILDHLLSESVELNQNQWFQVIQGQANISMKMGDYGDCEAILNGAEKNTKDRLFQACIKHSRGRLLIQQKRYEEGIDLISSSIRSFMRFDIPILTAISLNNRGVIYFIQGRFSLAEQDWNKARECSREANSRYAEVIIMTNLADIEINRSNLESAQRLLDKAYEHFREVKDFEGLALTEFNYALLEIARKDIEKALDHFLISERIAFPLPSPWARDVRRAEVIKRAGEMGFPEMESLINMRQND